MSDRENKIEQTPANPADIADADLSKVAGGTADDDHMTLDVRVDDESKMNLYINTRDREPTH